MIQRFDRVGVHLPEPDGPNPAAADAIQALMGEHSADATLMNYTFQSFNFQDRNRSPMLRAQSGADFDRAYRKQSGGRGHQNLNAMMDKVHSKAADATLNLACRASNPACKSRRMK
jgi:predicted outer membrane protein